MPGTDLADRQGAARLLAEYLVSVGEPVQAQSVYVHLYEMSKGRGERIDILWRMAVASMRAGDRGRATKELKQLLATKPDSETERAALSWLGHLQEANGAAATAAATWTTLVNQYPFSYYGVKAASRLKSPPPQQRLSFPALTISDTVAQPCRLPRRRIAGARGTSCRSRGLRSASQRRVPA